MASNSSSIGKAIGNIASKTAKSVSNTVKSKTGTSGSKTSSIGKAASQSIKKAVESAKKSVKSSLGLSGSNPGSSKKNTNTTSNPKGNKKNTNTSKKGGSSSGSSKGGSSSSKGSSSTNKGSTTAPKENLSAKELSQWKNSVDDIITKKLIPSLKKASDDALQLHKITSSGQDANNLSYRFNDLSTITSQSAKQLTLFMKSFDSDLTTYINVISKSEKNTSDKLKTSIDQFKESADKIAKLKM